MDHFEMASVCSSLTNRQTIQGLSNAISVTARVHSVTTIYDRRCIVHHRLRCVTYIPASTLKHTPFYFFEHGDKTELKYVEGNQGILG